MLRPGYPGSKVPSGFAGRCHLSLRAGPSARPSRSDPRGARDCGAKTDGFSQVSVSQTSVTSAGPMMTITSGSSHSSRAVTSERSVWSSGTTAPRPVSCRHSRGGEGHAAASSPPEAVVGEEVEVAPAAPVTASCPTGPTPTTVRSYALSAGLLIARASPGVSVPLTRRGR